MASSQSNQLQPFFSASARDQSAVLVTVAIVAAAVSVLAIAAKLFWRRNIFSLKIYDYTLLGGASLLFVYTGLTVYSANLGLGKHREDIDEGNLNRIRKVQYVVTLLGILIGACTKMSMCLFIKSINTYTNVFRANWVLMGTVGVFFLSTFLANCFRCSLPSPWLADSPASCPAAGSIYILTLVSSMITDTLIWVLAVVMICKVQTIIKTKVFVISLFSFRLICVATTLPALFDTTHLYNGAEVDYTWLSLAPAVWLAATANCSVITVCVPSLKGLFDSWLGNTIGLEIDAPYQLERMSGKNTFEATAYEEGGIGSGAATKNSNNSNNSKNSKNSSANRKGSSHLDSSDDHRGTSPAGGSARFAALRLGASQTNQAACYAERRASTPSSGGQAGHVAAAKRSHHDPDGLSSDDYDDEYDVHDGESVKRLTRGIVIRDEVEVRYEDGNHHHNRSVSGHHGHRREPSSVDDRRSWSPTT